MIKAFTQGSLRGVMLSLNFVAVSLLASCSGCGAFTNSTAATIELQTIPVGVSGDADFNCVNAVEGCGADSVHYRVNIDGRTGSYRVDARLLYQATQPGYVDGMHTVADRVNRFKVMYDAVPPSVEVLATAVN